VVYIRLLKRFRGGLVFDAHRLVDHSTLGLRVIKRKISLLPPEEDQIAFSGPGFDLALAEIRRFVVQI